MKKFLLLAAIIILAGIALVVWRYQQSTSRHTQIYPQYPQALPTENVFTARVRSSATSTHVFFSYQRWDDYDKLKSAATSTMYEVDLGNGIKQKMIPADEGRPSLRIHGGGYFVTWHTSYIYTTPAPYQVKLLENGTVIETKTVTTSTTQ